MDSLKQPHDVSPDQAHYLIGLWLLGGGSNAARVTKLAELFTPFLDGGCGAVHLAYDLRARKMVYVGCNGVA